MSTKLFVTADVHGHYTELMKALNEAGFDKDNPSHYFVSCGDLFDRGTENIEMYQFVKGLRRKFLIKGNHEEDLYNALQRGYLKGNEVHNGTDITVLQLLGIDAIKSGNIINTEKYKDKIYEICSLIDYMRDYYEAGKYIFVHGWLPVSMDDNKNFYIKENWRRATNEEYHDSRWCDWSEAYDKRLTVKDKIIVCGHRPARRGSYYDSTRQPDQDDPFYGDGVIALDPYVVESGKINVIVLEPFD